MDMARKFLQMGYTRSRRYANHRSGRKYADDRSTILPRDEDPEKAESAQIFYAAWQKVRNDREYQERRTRHRSMFEHTETSTKSTARPSQERQRSKARRS